MPNILPPDVTQLLHACEPQERDRAWAAFLDRYNAVLLRAARTVGPEHDAVMDRYTYILEQLRCDDFRRLRQGAKEPPADFTLWLAVVARRLSLDHYRAVYGRSRASSSVEAAKERGARKRLVDLIPGQEDINLFPDEAGHSADDIVTASERNQGLSEALSRLPARDRLLLRFRFDQDCSATEIASLMDFPTPFHVYRRIKAVLDVLKRELEQRGID